MSTQLDETIVQFSEQGLSVREIVQKLRCNLNNFEDYHAYYHFLISVGFYKTLVHSLSQNLKKNKSVHWYHLFFIINKYQTQMQPEIVEYFISNEPSINWMYLFGSSYIKNEEQLLELKNNQLRKYYQDQKNLHLELEKELRIAQSQKLFEKEKQIIDQLLKLDTQNPFFQKLKKEYERKQAIDTLNEYKITNTRYLYDSYRMQPAQKEIKKQVQKMMENFKKFAQENPEYINDMAIILVSIGYHDLALEFLEKHLDTRDRKWIYLELLLESGQFFRCLTFVDQLFFQGSLSSEDTFSLIYAKAQAYYGLKEYEKAKETLEDLVKVKPRYRLAQELLFQWKMPDRKNLL